MGQVTLERVLEEVRSLTPDEQRRLRELLDETPARKATQTTEEEFEQALLREGIISEIPTPITDFSPYRNRKPVPIRGKPISETIIEERR